MIILYTEQFYFKAISPKWKNTIKLNPYVGKLIMPFTLTSNERLILRHPKPFLIAWHFVLIKWTGLGLETIHPFCNVFFQSTFKSLYLDILWPWILLFSNNHFEIRVVILWIACVKMIMWNFKKYQYEEIYINMIKFILYFWNWKPNKNC